MGVGLVTSQLSTHINLHPGCLLKLRLAPSLNAIKPYMILLKVVRV
jgi:hypothetical protein